MNGKPTRERGIAKIRFAPVQVRVFVALAGLIALYGCATRETSFEFTVSQMQTEAPADVAWVDAKRVAFGLGTYGMSLTSSCAGSRRPLCDNQRGIRTWDIKTNTLSALIPDASTVCLKRGKLAVEKSAIVNGESLAVPSVLQRYAIGNEDKWQVCSPHFPEPKDSSFFAPYFSEVHIPRYYEFRQAYFSGYRVFRPDGRTLAVWFHLDGRREVEPLPGPWEDLRPGYESIYPTRAGYIVTRVRDNWISRGGSSERFFVGRVVSNVAVAADGCHVAFFGSNLEPDGQLAAIRLYATDVCTAARHRHPAMNAPNGPG